LSCPCPVDRVSLGGPIYFDCSDSPSRLVSGGTGVDTLLTKEVEQSNCRISKREEDYAVSVSLHNRQAGFSAECGGIVRGLQWLLLLLTECGHGDGFLNMCQTGNLRSGSFKLA
jgi:hypothetical protein